MPHADAISFVVTLGLLQIIFRIVSVVIVVVSVVTEEVFVVVSVVSLMFLSCLRQVYEVYILKKVAKMLATFFLVSFVFSLFSEFLFEPLVECHVGTDFLLVLRLGKGKNIAR